MDRLRTIIKRRMTFITLTIMYMVNRSKAVNMIKSGFFTPKARELLVEEVTFIRESQPFSIEVDGKAVQAWKYGEGPAILCVHGWASRGARFHTFKEAAREKGYSLVYHDGPGHGESEGKTSSYFQLTDAVRSLIKHIGQDNIVGIIGHSLGAAAVINAMDKEIISVPTVLIAPAWNMKQILNESFSTYGVPLSIFYSILKDYEDRYGYSIDKDNPYQLIHDHAGPLGVIHDEDDKLTRFNESQDVIKQIKKDAQFIPTTGLGHSRILNDPAVVKASLNIIDNNA